MSRRRAWRLTSGAAKEIRAPSGWSDVAADAVNRLADPNAIFTADTGMSCVWAARYLTFRRDQRFLASFGHGTMTNTRCRERSAPS